MVVDIPYIIRVGDFEEEFATATDLFDAVVGSLECIPDEHLPASIQILNIDEFAVETIERTPGEFYFFSENHKSKLARAFARYMKGRGDERTVGAH